MPTTYQNLIAGTTTDAPLLIGATTINSAGFASLQAVTAPDTMWITLDPEAVNGAPEIVQVTAHTAAATSCTIVRAQQSTVAREHPVTTTWVSGATKTDLDELPFRKLTTAGDTLYGSAANTASRLAIGTAGQILKVNAGATAPEWGQVAAAGIASDAVTTAKILDANVTSAKLAAAVAGDGLAGGAGTALSVNVDGSTIEISSDSLRVKDAGITTAKLSSTVQAQLTRCGVRLRRVANQSVLNSTYTTILWDTEDQDTDGFIAVTGGTITIPAGKGGVYAMFIQMTSSGANWGGNGADRLEVQTGGVVYSGTTGSFDESRMTNSIPALVLAAGDTLVVQVVQMSGAAADLTGRLSLYRVSI